MRLVRFTLPLLPLLAGAACGGPGSMQAGASSATDAAGAPVDRSDPGPGTYAVRNLVSDGAVPAEHTDPNLVNAWGLDALPTTPWWVADNGTNRSTLYDAQGVATPLVVDVPGAGAGAAPSGLAANPTNEFMITQAGTTGPAKFLFAGEDGTISAWLRTPDPISTTAVKEVDETSAGAIFKGLALTSTSAGARLYATDFHNATVHVYDGAFQRVPLAAGAFRDGNLPAGFAPFGVRVLQGVVVVTYAKQDAAAKDPVKAPGLGFVDAYSLDGNLLGRLASQGKLDAPWGLALAPAGFGAHSNRLLVGNFGDGRIVSFGLRNDGSSSGSTGGSSGSGSSSSSGSGSSGSTGSTGSTGDDHGNDHGNDNGDDHGNGSGSSHGSTGSTGDDRGNDNGNDHGNGNADDHGNDHHDRSAQEGHLDVEDGGVLLNSASGPITIDGLWALSFGNGGPAGPTTTLFFTAGPNDEKNGLFGRIDVAQ
jgi:uncharacterized protein (TIGR03118 family)